MAPTPPLLPPHHQLGTVGGNTNGTASHQTVVVLGSSHANVLPTTTATTTAAAAEDTAAQQLQPAPAPRRFFPRIKHLLTSDWEYFLQGVVHSLEATGAPYCSSAGQNPNNPWYKAFHSVYGGVAADCSVPTGKNRYHKFKDKIVELWQAIADEHDQIQQQQQQGGVPSGTTHHWTDVKQMALQQLNVYQQAVQTKSNGKQDDTKPSSKEDLKASTANHSSLNNNSNSSGAKRRRQPNVMMQQHHQIMKKRKEVPTTQHVELAASSTSAVSSPAVATAVSTAATPLATERGPLVGEETKWKSPTTDVRHSVPWSPPRQLHHPLGTAQPQLPVALQPLQSLQVILEQCHEYKEQLAQLKKSSSESARAAAHRGSDDDDEAQDLDEEDTVALRHQVELQQEVALNMFRDEFEQAAQSDLIPLLRFAKAHTCGKTTSGENVDQGTATVASPATKESADVLGSSSVPSPETVMFFLEQWLWGLHRWRMNAKLPASIKSSLIQQTYQQVFEAYATLRKLFQPSGNRAKAAPTKLALPAASAFDNDNDEDGEIERRSLEHSGDQHHDKAKPRGENEDEDDEEDNEDDDDGVRNDDEKDPDEAFYDVVEEGTTAPNEQEDKMSGAATKQSEDAPDAVATSNKVSLAVTLV